MTTLPMFEAIFENVSFRESPKYFSDKNAATAINAIRSAYSTSEAPSSRLLVEIRPDLAELVVRAVADERDRKDADHRDQSHQERVLDKARAPIVTQPEAGTDHR